MYIHTKLIALQQTIHTDQEIQRAYITRIIHRITLKFVLRSLFKTALAVFCLGQIQSILNDLAYLNNTEGAYDKKAVVLSVQKTNPADEAFMRMFYPFFISYSTNPDVQSIPDFTPYQFHQKLFYWQIVRQLNKAGYQVSWMKWEGNAPERLTSFNGIVLLGHGDEGPYRFLTTNTQQKLDFIAQITCRPENKGKDHIRTQLELRKSYPDSIPNIALGYNDKVAYVTLALDSVSGWRILGTESYYNTTLANILTTDQLLFEKELLRSLEAIRTEDNRPSKEILRTLIPAEENTRIFLQQQLAYYNNMLFQLEQNPRLLTSGRASLYEQIYIKRAYLLGYCALHSISSEDLAPAINNIHFNHSSASMKKLVRTLNGILQEIVSRPPQLYADHIPLSYLMLMINATKTNSHTYKLLARTYRNMMKNEIFKECLLYTAHPADNKKNKLMRARLLKAIPRALCFYGVLTLDCSQSEIKELKAFIRSLPINDKEEKEALLEDFTFQSKIGS